jgi:Uma2 family endonuclease
MLGRGAIGNARIGMMPHRGTRRVSSAHASTHHEESPEMSMVAKAKRWTLDELHRLPDDGNKYELVVGELFVTPAPSEDHETILIRLHSLLAPYVQENGVGEIFRPRAIIRFKGSEVEPDLFVRALRSAGSRRIRSDWDDAPAPRLVVEVLSPTTRRRDLVDKRELYRSAGAAEYWVIDPERRDIRVIRAGREDLLAADSLMWAPASAPPLAISVPSLFGDVAP